MPNAKEATPRMAAKPKPKASPKIEVSSELLAHAHVSKAWPLRRGAQGSEPAEADPEAHRRHHLRDGLRAVGPAAYRHVRRSRPHHHGAARLPRAHRGQDPDAAHLLLGRHGWSSESAGQHPQQGDGGRASGPTADASAGPIRRASELRPSQQCAAQSLSRQRSASTTSSSRPPSATRAGASTRRC